MEYIGVFTHLLTFTNFLGHQSSHPQLFLWKNHETKLWQSWVAISIETDHTLAIHGILLKTQHRFSEWLEHFLYDLKTGHFEDPKTPLRHTGSFTPPLEGPVRGFLGYQTSSNLKWSQKHTWICLQKMLGKSFKHILRIPNGGLTVIYHGIESVKNCIPQKNKSFKQQTSQCRILKYLAFVGFSWWWIPWVPRIRKKSPFRVTFGGLFFR